MKGTGRRLPKESFNPPTPLDYTHRQFPPSSSARDSDASFASSRPSSAGVGRPVTVDLYKDPSLRQMAISTVNSYLSSLSFHISFKPSFPTKTNDIKETLRFLLSRLGFHPTRDSQPEDDLLLVLRSLNCPFKFNKSSLKNPVPHQWHTFVALFHWLVQISKFDDHLATDSSGNSSSLLENNVLLSYTLDSYLYYIRGDDDAVEELDHEWQEKLEKEKGYAEDKVKSHEQNVLELEGKLEALRSEPSQREKLEKEKCMLEDDVIKFYKMIDEFTARIAEMEKMLADKERALEAKVEANKKICEENEELKKRVELQTINARDMERMRRELLAMERDIGEAETARNAWEEKSWELDLTLGHKFKDLEVLAMDCNQAIKRLKIGNGFQYALNPNGSTPTEIMGIDYKSMLKPALSSLDNEIKKGSMANLEELIIFQQNSSENAAKIEEKRNRMATLQSHVDKMEAQVNMLKKETEDYIHRCAAEAKKLIEDVQFESQNLDTVEREASEILKTSKLKLKEAVEQGEDEIQSCARELFALLDSVSKYKEYIESKISEMKSNLLETAEAITDIHNRSFSAQLDLLKPLT